MTVLEVLRATTGYLKKHHIDNPRLNAEHLMAHALARKRIELYLNFERDLTETELEPLRELVKRRSEGEPLQHLLGTVEFCGLTFACDKRALVPRSETEQLVELLLADYVQNPHSKIVDVGTGSGVIALSLASKLPQANLFAVDVSDDALALARENAARLGLNERVQFAKGSLLEEFHERFHVIVANLPYIAMQDRHTLSREVLHDPESALFAGENGDALIRALIEAAPSHLEPGGLLALEIGIGQSEGLMGLLTLKNYHDICPKNDYSGVTRFLFAKYG